LALACKDETGSGSDWLCREFVFFAIRHSFSHRHFKPAWLISDDDSQEALAGHDHSGALSPRGSTRQPWPEARLS
jgi:hypothetical protein